MSQPVRRPTTPKRTPKLRSAPADNRCSVCGVLDHEPCPVCKEVIHVGDWPWCPHGSTTRQRIALEPIVLFRRPDGRILFPGSNRDRTPKGCERITLDNLPAIERFERQYNATLARESSDRRALHDAAFSAHMKERRAELRQAMSRMHPLARAIAEAAMRKTDEQMAQRNRGEFQSGFEVLHYDQSNRRPQVDESTGWRPRHV